MPKLTRCSPRTRAISCTSRSRPPASRRSARPRASGSRTWPAGASWISTATRVHHIGYGHPRLIAAIKAQLDELLLRAAPLCLRAGRGAGAQTGRGLARATSPRCCSRPAARTPSRSPSRSPAAATGRFKTVSFWDAFHGAGFGAASVGGEAAVPLRAGIGPLLAGQRARAGLRLLPQSLRLFPLRPRAPYSKPAEKSAPTLIRTVLEKEGDVAAVIAEPMRAVPYDPAARLLAGGAPGLRRSRHAADLRRDPDRPRQDRPALRLASTRAWCPTSWCSARRSAAASCRSPPPSAGPNWTWPKPGPSATTLMRRTPLPPSAALTTLEIIEDEGLVARAAGPGRPRPGERLFDMMDRHAIIGDVRGRGLPHGSRAGRPTGPDPRRRPTTRPRRSSTAASNAASASRSPWATSSPSARRSPSSKADLDRALDILDESLGEAG